MYCRACGEIQSDLAHFCPSCGNKLSVSGRATTPKHRKQGRDIDTKQQKSESDGLAFFIISILCIATIFIPLGSFGESFYDRATSECFMLSTGPPYYEDVSWDCGIRDGGRIAILFLGLIGSICFSLFKRRRPEYEGHYNTPTKDVEQSQQSKPAVDDEKTGDDYLWELAKFESRKERE